MSEAARWSLEGLLEALPARQPYLLIDRVLELTPEAGISVERAVRADEPWVPGHFPGDPILPGVLQVEAMVQAAALLALRSVDGLAPGSKVALLGLDKVRFRRRVEPGEVLCVDVQVVRRQGGSWKLKGVARVGDERSAEATLRISLVEPGG
jgi:3-hydroxyacyl-[acyl-carrier-protein] dehydratase